MRSHLLGMLAAEPFVCRKRSRAFFGQVIALFVFASCGETPRNSDIRPADDLGSDTSAASSGYTSRGEVAFTHVTVIDPTTATPQENMTVIVRDGRIVSVSGDSVDVSLGAERVNAEGRFLIPGLWDAHAHVAYPGECALQLMIAHGVTTLRDLGGPPAEGIAWRREINEGRRIGPRLYLAGLNIESAEWLEAVERMMAQQPPDPSRQRIWQQSPRFKVSKRSDGRLAVDTAQRLGMDVVKFRNLEERSFREVAKAARRAGMPLAGHAPNGITLADAAEAGLGSLEHGANLSDLASLPPDQRKQHYQRIVRSGMFVTPTLVSDGMWAPDSLVLALLADTAGKNDARRRTLSPGQIEMWESMIRDRRAWSKPVPRHVHDSIFAIEISWVREAHRAGVPLLAGTDVGTLLTFPGSSLHEELELLVTRVGLTPLEALRSATVLPATFFGFERDIGIAPGKRADLVLLRANPLRDIRNVKQIEGVVVGGRYFDRDDVAALNACAMPRDSVPHQLKFSGRRP
jgi:imidazolonepropionase-like amidohydrolase